ncbi:Altered inheritance of mitochondria protein 36, mitochondrial [Debaryomyces fabryi]|uniref:Altered inheritance of mitochondria protein 36, mitochondrial n=1 Tax=Debaryomyces fabryi TaxID=58627 RepID=A0A0V1Q5Z2_9ASCO|nr:Altered inheritance of mitochondria protein 36, mitochondrial [Debaryomyces fabryi]KSA03890.1 Altered inheritance of mitochondria protein 36, mitochondrial [Debaryomyces fabryi]CUM48758.1 unnamed protein product [Debaryomyces fabryi]
MFRSSQLFKNSIRGMRNARIPITHLKPSPFMPLRAQFYSTNAKNEPPKLRFLFYMFIFASGVLYVAGNRLDKKKTKNSFTEKEFEEYEITSGLKRRSKLISTKDAEKYKFYVVPYVHQNEFITKIAEKLGDKEVRVIDPEELIKREREDESRHYSYLLQDLKQEGKQLPKGLVTALIKDDIKFYLNTRKGTFDTNFVIKNYPQTTDEAIKFENDISDIQKCIVLHYDMLNELKKNKGDEKARLINNVVGYFETVNKASVITAKHDELDDKLQEISLEFI